MDNISKISSETTVQVLSKILLEMVFGPFKEIGLLT